MRYKISKLYDPDRKEHFFRLETKDNDLDPWITEKQTGSASELLNHLLENDGIKIEGYGSRFTFSKE